MLAKKEGGFTLVEMMVTVAIGGVLLGVAVNSYASIRESTYVESAKEHVASIMQQARLRALSSGESQTVTLDLDNDTVDGISFDGDVDLQKIACSSSPQTLTNTGSETFTFTRRGSGTSKSIRFSSSSLSSVGVITVNGTTGRISVKDGC